MKKKSMLHLFMVASIVMVVATGCKTTKPQVKNSADVTEEPIATEANSSNVQVTEEVAVTQVPAIDVGKLEELKGLALAATDKAHSIYKGTFGEEEVLLELWIDKEKNEAQVSMVRGFHSDEITFSCELLEDGIRYQEDGYYMLLRQQEEDTFTGYFYESGEEVQDVSLKLDSINFTQDKDHLYPFGSNQEVEGFAQKVLDAINGYDMETLSGYIEYPIQIHVNLALQTIHDKKEFMKLSEEVVFTDDFVATMATTYPNIMSANQEDGALLGDGEHNVWINKVKDKSLKITAINN